MPNYDTITQTTGAAAVGYPGMMEYSPVKYRGYVDLWRNKEEVPYHRVWCKDTRWDYEAAQRDALALSFVLDGSASLYHLPE